MNHPLGTVNRPIIGVIIDPDYGSCIISRHRAGTITSKIASPRLFEPNIFCYQSGKSSKIVPPELDYRPSTVDTPNPLSSPTAITKPSTFLFLMPSTKRNQRAVKLKLGNPPAEPSESKPKCESKPKHEKKQKVTKESLPRNKSVWPDTRLAGN